MAGLYSNIAAKKLGSKLGLARKCVRLGPRAHHLRVRLRLRPRPQRNLRGGKSNGRRR
jgi:hypothetical protein